jgi:DNA-binding response OmpR family regulator
MLLRSKKILIIEDEEAISDLISYYLEKEGFITKAASRGEKGLCLVREFMPDLILLDLTLPDMDGFEVCKKVSADYIIPIIMLTAKSDTIDKILGIELGADDYITKPFEIREVIVRIKSIFRRIELVSEAADIDDSDVLELEKGIEIYKQKHLILKNGERIEFTNREYDLPNRIQKDLLCVPGQRRDYCYRNLDGSGIVGEQDELYRNLRIR